MRRNNELMDAYSHGKLRMEEYMDFSLEPMIGRTPEELEHLVGPWVEDFIEPIIFSDATKAIAAHRKAGDRILVISASGTHLVRPIAERLGIDEILAIELELAHGENAGAAKTLGTLTYREGKITRLLELAGCGRREPRRRELLLGLSQRSAAAAKGGFPARGESGSGVARTRRKSRLADPPLEVTAPPL